MRARTQLMEIEYRRGTRPRLLVGLGLALLAGLGVFGERTQLTWTISAGLATIAAYLVLTGRPQRTRVRFDPVHRTITTSLHPKLLGPVHHIELVARGGDLEGRPRPTYRAEAVTERGSRHEIYESVIPSDLVRWGRSLDEALPVRVAWAAGHPRVAEWIGRQRRSIPSRAQARRCITGVPYAGQKKVCRLLICIAGLLATAWALFILSDEAHPFSVALAVLAVAFVGLTAALVATDRIKAEIGHELIVERRRLGRQLLLVQVPVEDIRHAEALTPDGETGFLLLVTEQDILSVPLAEPATTELAHALRGA